jgi:hypothetical protein
MNEINLLRWQQAEENWQIQKKQKKIFIFLIIILLIIFVCMHVFLSNKNVKSKNVLDKLKVRMALYQTDKSNVKSHDDLSFEQMSQIKMSQQKFWQVLALLSCFSLQQIQMSKMNFQEKQISIAGWVSSTSVLSKALQFCLPDKKYFSIKKITFHHKNNAAFLQFSLLAI